MAKGISVHIGLNRVDSDHYRDAGGNPWDGKLAGCINDAKTMQAIAEKRGFKTLLLLDDAATAKSVTNAIADAATNLRNGDIFFISYSGHGGQVPDLDSEEEDKMDETWCLFDRQLVDDELYALWSKFASGVRIFMLSDSCHSGTMAKDPMAQDIMTNEPSPIRVMPAGVQKGTYASHKADYDAIQKQHPLGDRVFVESSVILISGCQDNQLSYDGENNGKFTGTLLRVWNNGKFRGDTHKFWKKIVDNMPFYQSPNLYKVGASNPYFEKQRPFTIGDVTSEEPKPPVVKHETLAPEESHAKPQAQEGTKMPVPTTPETFKNAPKELQAAWLTHMVNGFKNSETMFQRTLGAFMKPYQLTVWLYAILFAVGIGLFITSAVIGLTRDQPVVAAVFSGLGVATFIVFFIQQPLHALEENLEFITWLGVTFNTYWARLMYMLDDKTIQQDLKTAEGDFVSNIEKLIDKHAVLRGKRIVPKEPPAKEEGEGKNKPDEKENAPDTPDKPAEEA
ncbi:MAG: caspase family protein [Anaerolineae bacterium]|nr:caspase family protein [Anaerolineae bacterium]